MSLKDTKNHLIRLLSDGENKVVALSGKWGTGKSHMWEEIRKYSSDNAIKNSIYASLFGLSVIDQIKMRLIQNAMPNVESNPTFWKTAKQTVRSGIKVLEGFHKSFGALNDFGLVLAPAMLSKKLIVLDDIERKHNKLDIDELLGFIDEFTQKYASRFLLILNIDQLGDREVWDTLREKVVDYELRMDTSPSEAFDIASAISSSIYADHVRKAVVICGVINIRIIVKIIKIVNSILGNYPQLSTAVVSRIIPSTVLLSAINYKGIEDGPDFDFVLARGTPRDPGLRSTKKSEDTAKEKKEARWSLLMTNLGIYSTDNFELILIEFLQSGMFDISEVKGIIDRYISEADVAEAQSEAHKFFERSAWDYTVDDSELLADATQISKKSHLLDAYTVTSLYDAILRLPDGQAVADLAVNNWIDAFHKNNLTEIESPFFQRRLHPKILVEFESVNAKSQADTTAYDACLYIAEKSAWGTRQEAAMKSATVKDMEEIIRTRRLPGIRTFMIKMADMCINKQSYEKHFGTAMDNFAEACRNISHDPHSGRLGRLIKDLFAESGITHLLDCTNSSSEDGPTVVEPSSAGHIS